MGKEWLVTQIISQQLYVLSDGTLSAGAVRLSSLSVTVTPAEICACVSVCGRAFLLHVHMHRYMPLYICAHIYEVSLPFKL